MGTPRTTKYRDDTVSLADALFTNTQQRVLSLLFGQPQRAFGTTELIRLARAGRGAVQRELARLMQSGLVVVGSLGTQRRYQANSKAPIFDELCRIVDKTMGVPHAIRRALEPLQRDIALAVLYGSIAKGTDRADSDIDVLVVSDRLELEDIFEAIQNAETQLDRRVSPTLYTSKEFRDRRRTNHAFLARVLQGPHVVLIGSEDAVGAPR